MSAPVPESGLCETPFGVRFFPLLAPLWQLYANYVSPSDFADAHPSAMVIGTDLSPIQPNFVPPNLKFELDDAQLEWTYEENGFDFVHIRCLMGSINDWAKLYSEVFRYIFLIHPRLSLRDSQMKRCPG